MIPSELIIFRWFDRGVKINLKVYLNAIKKVVLYCEFGLKRYRSKSFITRKNVGELIFFILDIQFDVSLVRNGTE